MGILITKRPSTEWACYLAAVVMLFTLATFSVAYIGLDSRKLPQGPLDYQEHVSFCWAGGYQLKDNLSVTSITHPDHQDQWGLSSWLSSHASMRPFLPVKRRQQRKLKALLRLSLLTLLYPLPYMPSVLSDLIFWL